VDLEGARALAGAPPFLGDGWELRVVAGRGAGAVLVVPRRGGVLGSSRGCELLLPDEGVAPRHLRLDWRPDGSLAFADLGGPSPTLVDGEPRPDGPLPEGSRLQVGPVVLEVMRRSVTAPPVAGPLEEDEPPLEPGTVLDSRYRIDALIGRGGMGTVYRAEHLALGRPVALKVLRSAHGARTDLVQRFQREAVAAGQIRHPGIVEVLDFGRTPEGRFYLSMELVDGETLAGRLARTGPLAPDEALGLVRDIARALAAAHGRGILHRDVKPENVLLTSEGVKVVDFGIARLAEASFQGGQLPGAREARETAAGLIFGTPDYMSPEQAAGQRQDGRSDVYALGVLLYELLLGTPPFSGASATHVLAAHLLTPVPRLPAHGPHGPLPAPLADLVARMMAKAPVDRPESMDEVVTALEALLAGKALPMPLAARRAILPRLGLAVFVACWLAGVGLHGKGHAPSPRMPRDATPVASTPAVTTTPQTAVPPVLPAPPAPGAPQEPAVTPPAPPSPMLAAPSSVSTRPSPPRIPVEIRSTPSGARVSLHGRVLGTTPLTVRLPENVPVLLVFEASGRLSIAERVRAHAGLALAVQLPPSTPAPSLDDLKASPYQR